MGIDSCLRAGPSVRPRWYTHRYNRPELYRLMAALSWLPRRLRLHLASGIGRVAATFVPAERAATRHALAVMTGATGGRLDALTGRLFSEFAMCFSDLCSTNRQPPGRLLAQIGTVEGAAHLERLEGGVVSVTAHVGNWDLAGRLLARQSSRPTHVVVAVEEARALERWVRRDGAGVRFVSREHPTMSLSLLAALRRGEVVGMQGDRALGTSGDVLVPFFGRPAPFPVGPFRLASAARAPVIPAFCALRADRRYEVIVHPPLVIAAGTEQDALRHWVGHLEAVVRRRPTQWFNFFDIWNPLGSGDGTGHRQGP